MVLDACERRISERSANIAPAKKQNVLMNSPEWKKYSAVKNIIDLRQNIVCPDVTLKTRNTINDPRIS